MTLRRRITITVATVFSAILAIACTAIYLTSAQFRKDEFVSRLRERALSTTRLLLEVKEVDNQLLKLIDKNTINKYYNEKTLVFDETYAPIYSSLDDSELDWNQNDLITLNREGFLYRKLGRKELIGMRHRFENSSYYILISAEDFYGNRKLDYLLLILVITFLLGTALVWVTVLYLIKGLFKPLESFKDQIIAISANKLKQRLEGQTGLYEIDALADAFNQMIRRLDSAFEAQREFNASASHELRTPLARLTVRIDGLRSKYAAEPEIMAYLHGLTEDVELFSDLIQSLLLLSKLEKGENLAGLETVRVDELIFYAYEQVKKLRPDADLTFGIDERADEEILLEIKGNKSLLQIAFNNLINNAFAYSIQNRASVRISNPAKGEIIIDIENEGPVLNESEQKKLFQSFVRHSNSQNKAGSGLGLKIAHRILAYHQATIGYSSRYDSINCFTVTFKI